MHGSKTTFLVIASMSAVLLATMIRDVPASDDVPMSNAEPADSPTIVAASGAAAQSQSDVAYNRRIDGIGFAPSSTGLTDVIVSYSMEVGDTGATSDLSGEIRVEVLVDGSVVSTGIILGQFDFLANDAIICAVNCASNCGSIFGNGVCGGCDCSYNRTGSLLLAVPEEATVRASLLVFVTPEILTDDDTLEVVFGVPTVPCDEDLDGSGAVDFGDLLRVLSSWGDCV